MSILDLSHITLGTPDGSTLAFAEYRGRRAVLVLGNQQTGKLVREIAARVHRDPAMADVPVIQVAHLVGVPRLFKRLAERDIRQGLAAQRDSLCSLLAARGQPSDDADRLVTLGLDWDGQVTTALGFSAADASPLVAVIDENSQVISTVGDPALHDALQAALTPPPGPQL
jgi:hypothetical protein